MLPEPTGAELPEGGFVIDTEGFLPPAEDGSKVDVRVSESSDRIALLDRFNAWDGNDFSDLPVLLKADGKCTTDHISPAGKWLKYRGHLDNISNNMYIGAVNAFGVESYKPGTGKDQLDGKTKAFQEVARNYKANGHSWVVFGDENFGEGSSREHAAMEPRHLGCKMICVRSFARIHETNLKKQGVLALTFVNPEDYNKVREDDRVAVEGLKNLSPGKNLIVKLTHKDGTTDSFEGKHTLSAEQIDWFKAGSALNHIANQN